MQKSRSEPFDSMPAIRISRVATTNSGVNTMMMLSLTLMTSQLAQVQYNPEPEAPKVGLIKYILYYKYIFIAF